MARRRYFQKKHHSRPKFTLPLAVVAGLSSPIVRTFNSGRQYGLTSPDGAIAEFSRTMIGINVMANPIQFEWWRLRYGLMPVLLGLGVHKLANMTGVNRMLARAHVPIVRI